MRAHISQYATTSDGRGYGLIWPSLLRKHETFDTCVDAVGTVVVWVASKNSRKRGYVGVLARSEGGSRDTLSRAHFFHSRHQSAPPALPVQLTRVYHPRFPRAPPISFSRSLLSISFSLLHTLSITPFPLSPSILLSLSLYLSLLFSSSYSPSSINSGTLFYRARLSSSFVYSSSNTLLTLTVTLLLPSPPPLFLLLLLFLFLLPDLFFFSNAFVRSFVRSFFLQTRLCPSLSLSPLSLSLSLNLSTGHTLKPSFTHVLSSLFLPIVSCTAVSYYAPLSFPFVVVHRERNLATNSALAGGGSYRRPRFLFRRPFSFFHNSTASAARAFELLKSLPHAS
ncbi:uncharacterized protein LOC122632353 [Vespula pensylvanica]|uniref:uncharacterized protein LOC122632353 n=1 Tax=Vespula pensylvanica TaxID=30213 RepID=UPI001CBA39C9|nr:uncharacterized protein LOC122632353 [Vespula pensylvanica]